MSDILSAFERSDFACLDLAVGSVRLAVNRASAAAESVDLFPDATAVPAPLLGTFQAGSEAGAPALVQVGAEVQPDSVVGFIRVMKKIAEVKAGQGGTVVDIAVRDGQFVEYGQALMRINTSGAENGR